MINNDAAHRKGVNSIEIGFQLLSALAASNGPCSLKELCQATSMGPSKAHSYLVSYLRIGLVTQDDASSRYALGPEALRLGLAALRQLDVMEAARQPMTALREETGHTISLSVWGNHGPTVVRWVEGDEPILTDPKIGAVMPLLWSTVGRVFFTYLPESRTKQLVKQELRRSTQAEATSPVALAKIKKNTRALGLSIREEPAGMVGGDIYQPTKALSAPIFGHDSVLAGVMTLVGPARSVDTSPQGPVATNLRNAAAQISAALGYRPD